jgi:hypothetical protein
VANTAQKRALRNYRTRLVKRGMARFEVLGLDSDRDLIRSLAKRLAEANGCLVMTDNEKDFTGLKFVNPLRGRRTD